MSNIALSWAFKCHVGNASAKAVLVYLADRADDDGTAAYPKIATIVNVTELSERTVRTALKTLQERGFIRRGDQRYARLGKGGRNRLPQYCQIVWAPRGRIRPVDPRMDQGDAHGGTRPEDHGQYRGPPPPPPSWKTANPRTCCRKTLERSRSQHCKSRRAGKRAGTGTANPAGPALRELHPQHCKCRTPSTANLAELYI